MRLFGKEKRNFGFLFFMFSLPALTLSANQERTSEDRIIPESARGEFQKKPKKSPKINTEPFSKPSHRPKKKTQRVSLGIEPMKTSDKKTLCLKKTKQTREETADKREMWVQKVSKRVSQPTYEGEVAYSYREPAYEQSDCCDGWEYEEEEACDCQECYPELYECADDNCECNECYSYWETEYGYSSCDLNCCDDFCCCYYLRGLLGYAGGRTVGVKDGYGMLGLQLGTTSEPGCFYKAIEANAFFLENNRYAFNVGGLMRWYQSEMCSYFGMNLFYDYREGKYGKFQQVGFGFEGYFPCFTITANTYIPVGNKWASGSKTVYNDYNGDFQAICRQTELAMCGFNIDIGREFCPVDCFYLYPSIGPYYFSHCSKSFWGVRARARLRYNSRMGIEFQVTNDSVFGTRGQAFFYITFPIGIGDANCCCEPCELFLEPVDRFRVIPLDRCCNWDWNW